MIGIGTAEEVLGDLLEAKAPDGVARRKAATELLVQFRSLLTSTGFTLDPDEQNAVTVGLTFGSFPKQVVHAFYKAETSVFVVATGNQEFEVGVQYKRHLRAFVSKSKVRDVSGIDLWEPAVAELARIVAKAAS